MVEESPISDPGYIAEQMGICVLTLPMRRLYGVAVAVGDRKFMGVRESLNEAQQKLVIAHELAHFILHPTEDFFFVLTHTLFHAKLEHQANVFAVTLLMDDLELSGDIIAEVAVSGLTKLVDRLRGGRTCFRGDGWFQSS